MMGLCKYKLQYRAGFFFIEESFVGGELAQCFVGAHGFFLVLYDCGAYKVVSVMVKGRRSSVVLISRFHAGAWE